MTEPIENNSYTLLCYKPNSVAYFRGECDKRYPSDFKFFASDSKEEMARIWGQMLFDNERLDGGEDGYEMTLLINGKASDDDNWLLADEIETLAYQEKRNLIEDEKRQQEEAKAREEEAKALEAQKRSQAAKEAAARRATEKEAHDQAEYIRLKAKYEGAQNA